MKLTQKQRLFADEYIKSGNATQAAIRAGYSENYAKARSAQMLVNVGIKSYIDEQMAEIESHKIATAEEAMQGITAIARGEAKEPKSQINPLTGKWETIYVPTDQKTRLNAWKEVLKRYPLSDEFSKVQLRKLDADARVAEAKARAMEDNGQDVEMLITKMMDKVAEEDKNGAE